MKVEGIMCFIAGVIVNNYFFSQSEFLTPSINNDVHQNTLENGVQLIQVPLAINGEA